MTGFGQATSQALRLAVAVEIKSVNNRYLKVLVKLPDSHSTLEPLIERVVRERLTRGTVTVFIRLSFLAGAQPYRINEPVVRGYLAQLEAMGGRSESLLPAVLALPGSVDDGHLGDDVEEDWKTVQAALEAALQSLEQMRIAEGLAMQRELHAHLVVIRALVDRIAERSPISVEAYRDRLVDRVNDLLATQGVTVAFADLVREVSIFAERSDISEEIARLRSHVAQFDALMTGPDACGRKLDFLGQEMFRECNTMGAKSGDVDISSWVVELKSIVERIREMIANVE